MLPSIFPLAFGAWSASGALHSSDAIPYFARRYAVACSHCHVLPPKLNSAGEAFLANGYVLANRTSRATLPFAIWLSGRSESLPASGAVAEDVRAYLNRIELVSGGKVVAPWLWYFVEWRPLSQEARGDGTLRDRSGRFEDLFFTAGGTRADLTVGQFRQLGQVDVSRRLSLSEPLVFSSALPGLGAGNARERGLRSFAPAGRSPAVRAAWYQPLGDWRWTTAAAIPLAGEFSIPLSDEAKREASNELEWRAKGLFIESFVRRGLTSIGAHAFYDDRRRHLANAIVTGRHEALYWTAVTGALRTGDVVRGNWSIEAEFVPHRLFGVGARAEDRAGDGAERAYLPYVNVHFPGTTYTIRLTLERRLQRGRNATFVEFGTVF